MKAINFITIPYRHKDVETKAIIDIASKSI